ncbi:MAG: hypothetical protein QOI51_2513 [Nocardioidaceae bacterium]|nr:hypothetical protein [Nocardioidaceae bacterium]
MEERNFSACRPRVVNGETAARRTGSGSPRRAERHTQDREIARLAVPAFAALVSEPLFLLADAAIVGHLGTAQLAALGIAGAVLQTAVGIFIFLAYGTTSVVARNLGAGQLQVALTVGVDGIWLAAALGAVSAAASWLLSPLIVGGFSSDREVQRFATTYLRIASFGIPALLLMLAATGVLRGLQDTRTPLAVAVVANLANVGLNLTFVYGFGWGIAGSAVGTLVAQSLAALTLVWVVSRGAIRYGARLTPHLPGIRSSFVVGLPLLVRTLTLRAALLVATFVAASISTPAVAAHQVAFTVWTFLAFALDAIAIAGQAITGRLLGARDAEGVRAATRRMMWWGLLCGVALGVLLVLARPLVVPLFTSDADVQQLLGTVLLVIALHQPVSGLVFVLDGVLIGAGDGRYLAVAGLVTLGVFAPLAFGVLWLGGGLVALWWAFSGFMLARLATLLWRERGDAWLVLGASRGSPT